MNERAQGSTRVVAPADLEQELQGRLAASRPPRRVWGRRAKRFALRGTLIFQVFIIVFTLMAPMGISAGAPSSDGGATTTEASSSDDNGKGNDKGPGKPPAEEPTPAPEPDPTEAPAEEPAPTEAPAEEPVVEEPAPPRAATVAASTELETETTTTTEVLEATQAPIEVYAPSGPPTI